MGKKRMKKGVDVGEITVYAEKKLLAERKV